MRTPPTQSDSVVAQALATPSNFFSSGLRQKVDQLMNILWAGGVNNPMDSIEQISYLLFLRLLTEKDETLASLDIFWLKDESLEASDNLPDPDIIAAEITDDLEAALEQFRLIASDLDRNSSKKVT